MTDSTIYRMRTEHVLIVCVLGLLALGVIMVPSAAMRLSGEATWQWPEAGTRHLLFAGVALITFFVVGNLDYAALAKPVEAHKSIIFWLLGVAAFTCLIVLIPHVGIEVNGARRWLPLGPVRVQPSELAKWGSVLFLAWWLTIRPVNMDNFFKGFLPTLVPIALLCLLVVIQDFGTTALIGLCALTMLLAGQVKKRHLAIVLPPALAVGFWFIYHKQYRWDRMTAFLDPWASPEKEGYHMIQSLLSFATGGLSGRGLGNGIQKLGYLPEDTTDFIFATICEEMGVFGAMLTVALYLGIMYVAWQTMRERRDNFGRILSFGVGTMIGLQAMINLAVATVSVPTKGLSLPLVSAGGSGLVITCGALGLLLSITRHPHPVALADQPPIQPKRLKLERNLDGSLVARPRPDKKQSSPQEASPAAA